jgi:hypothetical protein
MLGKDWRRGFTPPTNRQKLENGAFAGWALFRALHMLRNRGREAEQALLAPFDGLITPTMLEHIRMLLPSLNSYAYQPKDFSGHMFPFDAYHLEADTAMQAGQETIHD